MKLLYGAIVVMSLAISAPVRAEQTTSQTNSTLPTNRYHAAPYGMPSATNPSAPPGYTPPAPHQPAAPYYAPPAASRFYGPYYAPGQRYLPPPPPNYVPRPFKADPFFTLLDVLIYRPIGLAATIAGVGLVVGMSPLTGLASIPRPHDAFQQTFDILVNAPAEYTFVRPLGERSLPFPYLPHY